MGNTDIIATDLMELTNDELVRHGFTQKSATLLENELLHRLEAYINMYGDYLDPQARERD
tara:strand:- start:455 stop:634 length:180 start_codon:yes stop_codon:yes gene_type:complete